MASTPKKHGSVWRIQVNKSGVRESGSFATRREAQDWAAKTEALALAAKQGKAPPGASFGQLLDKYAKEVSSKKKGELWETNKITHLQRQHPALCATKIERLGYTPALAPKIKTQPVPAAVDHAPIGLDLKLHHLRVFGAGERAQAQPALGARRADQLDDLHVRGQVRMHLATMPGLTPLVSPRPA